MKHLFVINPTSEKIQSRLYDVIKEIKGFFTTYPHLEYDIHVSRWTRDATAFVQRYALQASCLVRIHSLGGSGTLFDIVNGIIGLPNVQLAVYPMGQSNSFLRYFGKESRPLFASLHAQVFSGVVPMDALRCGRFFGISYGLVGLEAESAKLGTDVIERSHMKSDLNYIVPTALSILRKRKLARQYSIQLDGRPLDGDYITMMIANAPGYGKKMNPAIDAHPNDGHLDVYLARDMSKAQFIRTIAPYLKGRYDKTAGRVVHYTGKKLSICANEVMCLALDGETFYETKIEYQCVPYAIDFVLPTLTV